MDSKMVSLRNDTRVIRKSNLYTTEIDDELVMMDDEQGFYFGLNPTAKAVWELLDTPKTLTDLVTILTGKFDIDHRQCELDIKPFLMDLLKKKLASIVTTNSRTDSFSN